jgi:hypothetical protein
LILTNYCPFFPTKRNQAAISHNTSGHKVGKIENPAPIAGPSCKFYKSTGKSFSEALILASTNPKYDKRLFIELFST